MSDAKRSKILTAARSVFLRYGYKRVGMNDIAEGAGISRAALYLTFKSKEEIFVSVFQQWADESLAEIGRGMEALATRHEKIKYAFEIWTVRPFEMMAMSPEAKELVECSFDFAQAALKQGYQQFEATIAPVLAPVSGQGDSLRVAHLLASAVRGFKQTATTPDELRSLIDDLLMLSLTR